MCRNTTILSPQWRGRGLWVRGMRVFGEQLTASHGTRFRFDDWLPRGLCIRPRWRSRSHKQPKSRGPRPDRWSHQWLTARSWHRRTAWKHSQWFTAKHSLYEVVCRSTTEYQMEQDSCGRGGNTPAVDYGAGPVLDDNLRVGRPRWVTLVRGGQVIRYSNGSGQGGVHVICTDHRHDGYRHSQITAWERETGEWACSCF